MSVAAVFFRLMIQTFSPAPGLSISASTFSMRLMLDARSVMISAFWGANTTMSPCSPLIRLSTCDTSFGSTYSTWTRRVT